MTSINVNFVVLLLVFVLFSSTSARNITGIQVELGMPKPTRNLRVFVMPVGQGDCTLIQCPNGNIIIFDCGSRGGNRLEAYQIKSWLGDQIDRVSHIFISHSDIDHHIFLPDIFCDEVDNKFVVIGGELDDYSSTNSQYRRTYDWLKKFDSKRQLVIINNGDGCIGTNCFKTPLDLCLGGIYKFYILAANIGPTSNEKSIVMKIVAPDGWSMLLSGDMEGSASEQIVTAYGNGLQSQVYQMSHHGASRLANKAEWIEAINPVYAFASSGYNYGNCHHPRCDTIERLLDYGNIGETTRPHDLYCGCSGDIPPEEFSNVNHNILETSPTDSDICLLMYESFVNNNQNDDSYDFTCIQVPLSTKPSQLADDEAVYEDDCDDETPYRDDFCEAAGERALSKIAH